MTISINKVLNFDRLPVEAASRILYEEIIPACEAKGIKLSSYGNHSSRESLASVERYNRDKEEHRLFNVERVQRAFKCLDEVISNATVQSVGSYGFKHVVERHQNEYITNGDCIAAMLVKGYMADFGSENPHVNCQFNIRSNR